MTVARDMKDIQAELEGARSSRAAGKEGRARVCARRAAGWAIGMYKDSLQMEVSVPDRAFDLLLWFQDLEGVRVDLQQAAHRLTARVLPDHSLPFEQDPLEDAELIVHAVQRGRIQVGG